MKYKINDTLSGYPLQRNYRFGLNGGGLTYVEVWQDNVGR